jgi:hypothetical protein
MVGRRAVSGAKRLEQLHQRATLIEILLILDPRRCCTLSRRGAVLLARQGCLKDQLGINAGMTGAAARGLIPGLKTLSAHLQRGERALTVSACLLLVLLWLPAAAASTPPAPGQPRVTGVTTSSLSFEWAVPSSGGPFTKYGVQYKASGAGAWRNSSQNITGTTHTVTSLAPNQQYTFRVQAYNTNGAGAWSPEEGATIIISFKTHKEPGPPGQAIASSIQPRAIVITWAAPNSTGGLPIRGYDIIGYLNGQWEPIGQSDPSAMSFTVSNLSPGTAYRFKVAIISTVMRWIKYARCCSSLVTLLSDITLWHMYRSWG